MPEQGNEPDNANLLEELRAISPAHRRTATDAATAAFISLTRRGASTGA
jgi:hypothetical protein